MKTTNELRELSLDEVNSVSGAGALDPLVELVPPLKTVVKIISGLVGDGDEYKEAPKAISIG